MINIAGVTIAVENASAIGGAITSAIKGIGAKKSAEDIVKDMAPEVITIVEDVANLVFPGAGTAIEIISFLITHSQPMTQEETNKWMDRFGAGSQS